MKKLVLVGLAAIALAACGNDNQENNNETSDNQSEQTEQSSNNEENDQASEQKSDEQVKIVDENGYLITPTEVPIETDTAVYQVNDIRMSQNSMTGEPIVVLEIEFTNKTENPQSPYMSFIQDFAVQQTDGTTTEELMGANGQMGNEDAEKVEMGDANVNGGQTVEAIIGFQPTQPEEDIVFTIRSTQITGENIGFRFSPKENNE